MIEWVCGRARELVFFKGPLVILTCNKDWATASRYVTQILIVYPISLIEECVLCILYQVCHKSWILKNCLIQLFYLSFQASNQGDLPSSSTCSTQRSLSPPPKPFLLQDFKTAIFRLLVISSCWISYMTTDFEIHSHCWYCCRPAGLGDLWRRYY
jgi:hypothetical protein